MICVCIGFHSTATTIGNGGGDDVAEEEEEDGVRMVQWLLGADDSVALVAAVAVLLVAVVLVWLVDPVKRTSHKRNVPLPAVILHKTGSDVGWKVAAMMGADNDDDDDDDDGVLLVLELPILVLLLSMVAVLILPMSRHGWFVDDGVDDAVSVHKDTVGFQKRIIASEHPTANNDPDAFQHTFRA